MMRTALNRLSSAHEPSWGGHGEDPQDEPNKVAAPAGRGAPRTAAIKENGRPCVAQEAHERNAGADASTPK
jgi:hypothetical protein